MKAPNSRKPKKSFFHLLLFLMMFWQCTPEYEFPLCSYEQLPPSIFVFLNTAADSQFVIISEAAPADTLSVLEIKAELERLRQAKVTLTGNDQIFTFPKQFEYVHDSVWDWTNNYDFATGFGTFLKVSSNIVLPSTDYFLKIEIPEKGVFTAQTRSPGDFKILVPNRMDTIDVFSPLYVSWTPADEAAGYRVSLWSFEEDSSWFRWGNSDEIYYNWSHQQVYVEANEKKEAIIKHRLDLFYTTDPDDKAITLLKLSLSIEALDTPAWLAYKINSVENENEGSFRFFDVVSYSNIENGRGLMSAITTKTIPLAFPKDQK